MLEIKANTCNCLELRKKKPHHTVNQRNLLSSSSSIEGAVVLELFYITRRLFQCKVRFIGRFSLNSHLEKKMTRILAFTQICVAAVIPISSALSALRVDP